MSHVDPKPYILCEDLFKIYKVADLEVVALRGLDLAVTRGEVVGIVGASGSGKTTLLNILAGYDSPSAGGVKVNGRDLLHMNTKEAETYRREEVGFVWQQTSRNLFPYLSALENVTLPMMLTDVPGAERGARATELLELAGLGSRLHHTPERMSGGEQQRVAIAVALANRPPLLLADEPTGELDDATASEILDLLSTVNKETGTTIVIVSHDPGIAWKVGRVILIRDGRMSAELRRKTTHQDTTDGEVEDQQLEEFVLVDASGRVQIPREFLERLNISDRARVSLEEGRVTLLPEESTD